MPKHDDRPKRRLIIGTGISLLLLALAFRDINLSQVSQVLVQADFRWVALAVASTVLTAVAKASRWWLLFYPYHRSLRFRKVLAITLIGQMVNFALPARLGEVTRIYLIGEIEHTRRARALGTIALEKLIDLLMVPVMLGGLVFMIPLPVWVQEPGTQATLIGFGVAVVVLVGQTQRQRIVGMAARSLSWLPGELAHRIASQLELAISSVEALRTPGVTLILISGSIGIWILSAVTNYLVFLALDLQLPFSAALFLLIVLTLGVAVPSVPGKVGVFHYLCILGLGVFGVAREPALGYALLLYAVVFIPISVAGAVGLWWENLSLRRIQALALEPES